MSFCTLAQCTKWCTAHITLPWCCSCSSVCKQHLSGRLRDWANTFSRLRGPVHCMWVIHNRLCVYVSLTYTRAQDTVSRISVTYNGCMRRTHVAALQMTMLDGWPLWHRFLCVWLQTIMLLRVQIQIWWGPIYCHQETDFLVEVFQQILAGLQINSKRTFKGVITWYSCG